MLIKLLTYACKGRENSSAKRDKYGGQQPAKAKRIEARRAETTPSGGRVLTASLHNNRRYVCLSVFLSVCMLPMAGRTAGPIKTKLGMGTHVEPGSVLVKVKVKVIYLCVRYKEFMTASPGK